VFREVRKVHKIFDGKLKGRHNLGHLVVNWMVIEQCIFNTRGVRLWNTFLLAQDWDQWPISWTR
jgi:hypothetical protein